MKNSCIILAGGLGTRLRSAVPDLPKCLAPIAGRPFLEWQLRSLVERGVDRFVLALGYGAGQVIDTLNHSWARNLTIDVVTEPEMLGTGGAVRFAMDEIGLNEALVVNGDTFLMGSLSHMLFPLDLAANEFMRMGTVCVPDRARFGGVVIDSYCRVTAFSEKGQIGSGLINAGLYRIHRQAFDYEFGTVFSLETKVMPELIRQHVLSSCELEGPFVDIGVPEDYRFFDMHVSDYVG